MAYAFSSGPLAEPEPLPDFGFLAAPRFAGSFSGFGVTGTVDEFEADAFLLDTEHRLVLPG